MRSYPLYSIVLPVYNEAEVLDELYRRLSAVCASIDEPYEIIFVNDGSRDRSGEILHDLSSKDPHVKIIHFSRNFGHQAAITAGMDYASGEAVIVMDADLQDPPELIPTFLEKWQAGSHVVYGERRQRRGEGFFKKATARLFYRTLQALAHYPIPMDAGDFHLADRKVVAALQGMREQHRFMRGLTSWVGFRQEKVAFVRDPRYAGTTKYPFKKMLRFALDGITSFSALPLRMVVALGFVTIVITLALGIYVLVARLIFHQTMPGWASVMITVLFIGGVQLTAIGLIAEYIGRIYEEVKRRPLYIVESQEGFKGRKE